MLSDEVKLDVTAKDTANERILGRSLLSTIRLCSGVPPLEDMIRRSLRGVKYCR